MNVVRAYLKGLLWATLIGCGAAHAQSTGSEIQGAGATFPAAVYLTWCQSYSREHGIVVRYQPSGSGDGIKQISARAVDFGATDVPIAENDLGSRNLHQFPTLVGGVVPAINLPGMRPGQLRLTGALLAEIFAGRITHWNDSRIRSINPDLALPPMAIARIVREDSSGTTRAVTDYLGKSSAEWKNQIGSGLMVNWPGRTLAGKGNDGVAQLLAKTPGSIGYLSYNTVLRNKLVYVQLQNRSNRFVAPSEAAFTAAVKASGLGTAGRDQASLIDQGGPEAWPITEMTYIVIDRNPQNSARAAQLLRFFYWVFLKGDGMATGTGFAPLPAQLQARIVSRFAEITARDGKPIDYLSSLDPGFPAGKRRG